MFPRRVFIWFLAIVVAVPPFVLILLGNRGYTGQGPHWYSFTFPAIGLLLTLFGTIVVAAYIIYIWSLRKSDSEFQHLIGEIKFVAFQSDYLLVLAGGVACFLVGVRFLIPVDIHHLYERYEATIQTYIAVFLAVLGIKLLYRKMAPIVEVDHLLRMLIDDLNRHIDADRLWVVYPALNIGYYRHHLRLGKVGDEDLCEQYKDAQRKCAGRLKQKARAITYPKTMYSPLYTCYDRMINGAASTERVEDCVADAEDFVNDFTEQKPTQRGVLYEIPPDQFPPHVIVIGNIVYMIMSYGLPIYEPQTGFRPIGEGKGKDKLADLLVYRRNDPETADVISKHLEEIIKRYSPSPPTSSAGQTMVPADTTPPAPRETTPETKPMQPPAQDLPRSLDESGATDQHQKGNQKK
jgi:hypothetical protein